jgi:ABC-type dipeptide/oligopeptide/nickel transport system permease component
MIRQNMVKVLQSEFILYARASGLPDRQIALYTLRNAFAPSLTLFAILLAFMIGGAVLVETVFSWGGLGQYSVRSILSFDYPAIQGVILVITMFSLLVYLALDIVHALLDPRVTLH